MEDKVVELIVKALDRYRDSFIDDLENMSIDDVLKSPYLLAATLPIPELFIPNAVLSFLNSSAETKIGDLMEDIVENIIGVKSSTNGLDFDFIRGHYRFLMAVKNGPAWGNSSSTESQGGYFTKAKDTIGPSKHTVMSLMGICTSKRKTTQKLNYADLQIAGQNFWYFLTGDLEFYTKITVAMASVPYIDYIERLEVKKKSTCERLLNDFKLRYPNQISMWEELTHMLCGNYSPKDEWVNTLVSLR